MAVVDLSIHKLSPVHQASCSKLSHALLQNVSSPHIVSTIRSSDLAMLYNVLYHQLAASLIGMSLEEL